MVAVGARSKDLASSPAEKRAAARALERHIEPDTGRAGRWAEEETAAAVRAFGTRDGDGWLTSAALRGAHETWTGQVRDLLHRLSAERESLHGANVLLTDADLTAASAARRVSALDRY
ncbi:hypothetical protein [Streptomyces mangrovisoli]|uniref:hypothetical protein n=1 Tax=Streptomyces mangrovisoli TaxID=1428628 RepID=UPI00142DAC94|nr:hypothetical protein [Streptomyces mangrovisoli]